MTLRVAVGFVHAVSVKSFGGTRREADTEREEQNRQLHRLNIWKNLVVYSKEEIEKSEKAKAR